MERQAIFAMDGWSGRTETPCVVIGETPKRYRVRLLERCRLPGRGKWGYAGETVLIPRTAIRFHS